VYGEPIDLSAYYGRRMTHPLLMEVTDLLMRRLAKLGGVDYSKDVRSTRPIRPDSGPEQSVRPAG